MTNLSLVNNQKLTLNRNGGAASIRVGFQGPAGPPGSDASTAGWVNNPASATRAAISATFVRFVDENGNPFPGTKLVTISVNTATNEILDITAQAV